MTLGYYKNEFEESKELLTFTSLGRKSYFMEIGEVYMEKNDDGELIISVKVTDTLARSKGLSLNRQNVSGLITKNLMREFLQALAENKTMAIPVSQFRFEIAPKTYTIKPKEYEKMYTNKRLLTKRMYLPSISSTQTYPIGATEFYA